VPLDKDRKHAARAVWLKDHGVVPPPPQGMVGRWQVRAGSGSGADGSISVLAETAEWYLMAICGFVGDDLVLTEMLIRPQSKPAPTNGVNGTLLRSIPVAGIIAEARRQAIQAPAVFAAIPPEVGLMSHEALSRVKELAGKLEITSLRRGGRRGFPDDFYRGIAGEYLELQSAGIGRGILLEIAQRGSDRLGRPVARETARDWVRRATELGYLSPGMSGKAGRLPGPNLFTVEQEEP
jgi:hypothetical protein